MQTLSFKHTARSRLPGKKDKAIIGVVASGNLEVLLERVIPGRGMRGGHRHAAHRLRRDLEGGGRRFRRTVLAWRLASSRSMTAALGRIRSISA